MKRSTTLVMLCTIAVALFYTSCKKNSVKPAATATTVNYATLSSQLATTFYKSITGQYGGTDVSKGINSPISSQTANAARGRLSVFDTNPLCGYTIDTAYNYSDHSGPAGTITPNDTLFVHQGQFKFVYNCGSGTVNGYSVDDSVALQTVFIWINTNTAVQQKYTVQATGGSFKQISMNGSLTSASSINNTDDLTLSSFNAAYTLNNLTVNFSSGVADVISGVATFHTVYIPTYFTYEPATTYTYDGTIQFLGNHMARLTINTKYVYLVNLLSGVVTPA